MTLPQHPPTMDTTFLHQSPFKDRTFVRKQQEAYCYSFMQGFPNSGQEEQETVEDRL